MIKCETFIATQIFIPHSKQSSGNSSGKSSGKEYSIYIHVRFKPQQALISDTLNNCYIRQETNMAPILRENYSFTRVQGIQFSTVLAFDDLPK